MASPEIPPSLDLHRLIQDLIVANSARGDLLNPTQIAHEIRGKIPGISMSATELADTVTKMADGMPRGLPECRDWS